MASATKTLFGKRLREARIRAGLAQDVLGVLIGLDEGCSSARISRYETGIHEPPFETANYIADALQLPVTYFYCQQDEVAKILLEMYSMTNEELEAILIFITASKNTKAKQINQHNLKLKIDA